MPISNTRVAEHPFLEGLYKDGYFRFVARAYGFEDADTEDLIATREW
ncbi:DUF5713 family protein [Streptomyces sp. Ag109_G2-15]|nr:DUF5713 family protein [Streptomyces sp. Ag109_G2-15]